MKNKIHSGSLCSIQNLSKKISDKENYKPSEYVRLEADFFTESYSRLKSKEPAGTSSRPKKILLISSPHPLLKDIVFELQSNLGDKVKVLIASDHQTVQIFLGSEDIWLVLYTSIPEVNDEPSILKTLRSDGNFNLKSTLILLRKTDPRVQSWIQNPLRSKHIIKAINQLNALT